MWYKNFEEFKKQFELHKPEIDKQVRGSHRTSRRNTNSYLVIERLTTVKNIVNRLTKDHPNLKITKIGGYTKKISRLSIGNVTYECDINELFENVIKNVLLNDGGDFILIEISTGEVFAFNYNHIESPLLTYVEITVDPDIFYIWHNEIRITESRYWEN